MRPRFCLIPSEPFYIAPPPTAVCRFKTRKPRLRPTPPIIDETQHERQGSGTLLILDVQNDTIIGRNACAE